MKKYFDSNNRPCTLEQMVQREPGWAANRIRACEEVIENLRDRFAMAALTGFSAATDERSFAGNSHQTVEEWRWECAKYDAEYCYRMADAMMEARKI